MASKKSGVKQIDPMEALKAFNREKKKRYDKAMKDADSLVAVARRCKAYGTTFAQWTEACCHAFFYDYPRLPKRK